jgi:uncharacterized membrane protein
MRKVANKSRVKPLVFFGLLLIPTFLLCCGPSRESSSMLFFIVITAMLLTSLIEIPVHTTRTRKPDYSEAEARCIGELYGVPLLDELQVDAEKRYTTKITVNMGGFLIPLVYSFLLLLWLTLVESYPVPLVEVVMATLLLTLICFMLAEVKNGVGIVVPIYVGLFAIPLGFLLAPADLPLALLVAVLIFVPAIFGILLGMLIVLITFPKEEKGSAFFSLGGIGSFYSIYLIAFLALVLSSIT